MGSMNDGCTKAAGSGRQEWERPESQLLALPGDETVEISISTD